MKRSHYYYAVFFLLFCGITAFFTVNGTLKTGRDTLYADYYERKVIKKAKIYPEKKKIRSPYSEQKAVSAQTVSVKPNVSKTPANKKKARVLKQRKTLFQKTIAGEKIEIKILQEIEKACIKSFPYKDEFSELNMWFKYCLGMVKPIENEVTYYDRKEQRLDRINNAGEIRDISPFHKNKIRTLAKIAQEKNAPFILIAHPYGSSLQNGKLISKYYGLYDYYNLNRLFMQEKFTAEKYEFFNMIEAMSCEISEQEMKKYFYNSDHHWNVYGALLGAKLLARYLNDKHGCNFPLEYLAPDCFKVKRYPKAFVGSLGKKLHAPYMKDHSPEDFEILIPSYKTDFTVSLPHKNISRKGGFLETMIFATPERLRPSGNSYSIFLNGNEKIVRIINHNVKTGKKLLFIKNSYVNAMAPYLALFCKEVVLIDVRKFKDWQTVYRAIKAEKPDIVLYMTSFSPVVGYLL